MDDTFKVEQLGDVGDLLAKLDNLPNYHEDPVVELRNISRKSSGEEVELRDSESILRAVYFM